MNIKEIAKKAGVSVATVSHVVNKTRYVSEELTERVYSVINDLNEQPNFVLRNMKAKNSNVVLCLVQNLEDYFYIDIIKGIKSRADLNGYNVVVLNSYNKGVILEYIRLEKPCGIIIISDKNIDEDFFKKNELCIPFVNIGHVKKETKTGHIIIDYYEQAYRAVSYVIKNGHEKICFINDSKNGHVHHQRFNGYKEALQNNGIKFDPALVIDIDVSNKLDKNVIEKIFVEENRPTVLLSADGKVMMELLKFIKSNGIKCPDDISLVCFDESEWNSMVTPPLTTVAHDPVEIGIKSIEKLCDKLSGSEESSQDVVVLSKLNVRSSTQCIGRGPLGEKAESPEVLQLSSSEIDLVKSGSYTAAISFHYSGTGWARLHERGIRDIFAEMGVKVLAITDAHFEPELQIKQLKSILTMNPDILISVPADEMLTVQSYREVVNSGIKLVLINNVPNGFEHDDYVTFVSINERENGQIAGRILGEYLTRNNKKNIGLIVYGSSFFATKQRDMSAEQVLREEFPELKIVSIETFTSDKMAFDKCYEMIKSHPEIEGLYVSWEGPALEVLNALRELNREDIGIVTVDLDSDVALNMAMGGAIKGLSSQRPYEQGRAVALAAVNALIGKEIPSFIGVTPYKITSDNLLIGWQDIFKERPPVQLINALKSNKNRY